MAHRQNKVPPQVAGRLAEMVRELREMVYGETACPEWGTKFREIEEEGMGLGKEVARLFMEQAVEGQARGDIPREALNAEGDTAVPLGIGHETRMETQAGDVAWQQPVTRLAKAQRDFFPSSQSAGR